MITFFSGVYPELHPWFCSAPTLYDPAHSLTLAVIHMLITPKDVYQPIFDSSLSASPTLVIRFYVSYSVHEFFPLGSFVQVAQSFFAGSSALPELSARTSGFPLDCDPSAWLGAPWGQDPVLFLFFIHPRAYTVLGYSKCSIKFVENTVINVVIEMCVQSPVGRPRRENYISILSRAGGRGKMEKD